MLNDQLSLFEKLIWSAYIIVWVWMWACLLGNNEHLWKLHGIYSRNPIPKDDEKKSSNDLFGAKRVLSFLGK